MITCPKCRYRWSSKSELDIICCPNCHRKFRRPKQMIEIVGPIAATAACHQCGRELSDLRAVLVDDEAGFICAACLKDLMDDD